MDFAQTRRENDEKLLPRIEEIRAGQAFDALEPFAKAYLGLFFEIDANLAPEQRVAQLANPELQQAVFRGFENALDHGERLPGVAQVARQYQQQQSFGEGYIVLAGLDRLTIDQVRALPDTTLQAAIAFHYANTIFHDNRWLRDFLRQEPHKAGDALLSFWSQQLQQGARQLQGLRDALYDEDYQAALAHIVIRLLGQWQDCKSWTLRSLLLFALEHASLHQLLVLCRERLQAQDKGRVRHYVYWLCVHLILEPQVAGPRFVGDMGRTKDKILPLFDFALRILRSPARQRLPITAETYAHLLRVIAPRFHPYHDDFGQMEEKSKNVIWLFEQLKSCDAEEALAAIKRLQKVRVMRVYNNEMQRIATEISQTR